MTTPDHKHTICPAIRKQINTGSLKVAGTYALAASLWILLSDSLFQFLIRDVEQFARFSVIKGQVFVVATSAMLFQLSRRHGRKIAEGHNELLDSIDQLKQSEKRQADILNAVPSCVYVKDRNYRYVFGNNESCKVLGINLSDLIGKTDQDIFEEASYDEHLLEDAKVMLSGESIHKQETVRFLGIGEKTYLTTKTPLFDTDGNIVAICGVSHDISERHRQEIALAQSEMQLKLALSASKAFVWRFDPQTRLIETNGSVEQVLGMPVLISTLDDWAGLVHPDDLGRITAEVQNTILSGGAFNEVFRVQANDSVRWVRTSSRMMDGGQGYDVLIGTATDVTEEVTQQMEVEHSRLRWRALFEGALDGIVLLKSDGSVVEANAAFASMIGVPLDQVAGMKVWEWDCQFSEKRILAGLKRAHIDATVDTRWRHSDGSEIAVEVKANSGMVNGEFLTLCTCRDLTDRLNAQESIRRLAFFDDVTALPNRHSFLFAIDKAILESNSFGVILADMDRFRDLNDNYGHDFGDRVIQTMAEISSQFLEENDLLARIGGDEFGILVHKRPVEDVVNQIMEALNRTFEFGGVEIFFSASFGVCQYPAHGQTSKELLQSLDIALYQAKQQGRGHCAYFTEEARQEAKMRHVTERALRGAVEREEFRLFYQPIVDLSSNCIIGSEALVRWEHPTFGIISPDRFIGIAEETNLIIPMGHWILDTACRQSSIWQKQFGIPLKMSVNFSPKQFADPHVVENVGQAIATYGIDPATLQIEITESLLMADPVTTMETLKQLKELGVLIAIDDFGTGYSSLGFLHQYPIDCLKVDRSFVKDIEHDGDSAILCQTIISLGHNLNLAIVAEGVETSNQETLLSRLGCEMGQGYLYSKPICASDFTKLFQGHSENKAA